MCGIAGIVDGEHRMKYRNQQAVEEMLDTMKRRGPDQQNIYTDEAVTLLHARLKMCIRDSLWFDTRYWLVCSSAGCLQTDIKCKRRYY